MEADISKSALPALLLDKPTELYNGIYEIPASQLKSWVLTFSQENPDKIILWAQPSGEEVMQYANGTKSDHVTAYLVYTAERGVSEGSDILLERER